VNIRAALEGNSDIAFGNIAGSNIANVALVIGLCAMMRTLRIDSTILARELPLMLLATAAAMVLGLDRLRGEAESYDRSDGVVMLMLFAVFLYFSISDVLSRRTDPIADEAAQSAHRDTLWSAGRGVLLTLAGLVLLVGGADLTVARASSLAEDLGVPRVVIGLTLVALGTSLPELVTSLVATARGQIDLAVGNVVGSNIFNLLFILGVTSAIRPVEVPRAGGGTDLAVMGGLAAALLVVAHAPGSRIRRWHGVALVASYVAYVTWRLT
jgi:cation:H+ antiporter